MPSIDDRVRLDHEALRAKVAELKSRLAALHERVSVLEEKKRRRDSGSESTHRRS